MSVYNNILIQYHTSSWETRPPSKYYFEQDTIIEKNDKSFFFKTFIHGMITIKKKSEKSFSLEGLVNLVAYLKSYVSNTIGNNNTMRLICRYLIKIQ